MCLKEEASADKWGDRLSNNVLFSDGKLIAYFHYGHSPSNEEKPFTPRHVKHSLPRYVNHLPRYVVSLPEMEYKRKWILITIRQLWNALPWKVNTHSMTRASDELIVSLSLKTISTPRVMQAQISAENKYAFVYCHPQPPPTVVIFFFLFILVDVVESDWLSIKVKSIICRTSSYPVQPASLRPQVRPSLFIWH